MADYVWWFLIVGLVAGGGAVAFFMTDVARRAEDLDAVEREAEASLIAGQLAANGHPVDRATVASILRADRDYRRLPPPDRFERSDAREQDADDDGLAGLARPRAAGSAGDGDPDRQPDDVGHGRRRGADEDLPPA